MKPQPTPKWFNRIVLPLLESWSIPSSKKANIGGRQSLDARLTTPQYTEIEQPLQGESSVSLSSVEADILPEFKHNNTARGRFHWLSVADASPVARLEVRIQRSAFRRLSPGLMDTDLHRVKKRNSGRNSCGDEQNR